MTKTVHRLYLGTLTAIVLIVTAYLFYSGSNYYNTTLEERFYHVDHNRLKPSGGYGHGLGIVGTVLILIGVFGYQFRKYNRKLAKVGVLKHWLEFHIFLCVLGPIMILFHTSFKFGGIVSISFWSMVLVVASGVAGRFIYLQIPRTIQGKELSLGEINELKNEITSKIEEELGTEKSSEIRSLIHKKAEYSFLKQYFVDRTLLSQLKTSLLAGNISGAKLHSTMQLISRELTINRRVERLMVMQKLFKYWHVAHLPFAIIMLVIMVIHVAVTLAFGYKWIF
jgi:hypothetical protein